MSTLLGVLVAQFPYWAVRCPSEVLKTRAQAGLHPELDLLASAREAVGERGVKALWAGYGENIAYAFPADAIKFLVYEALTSRTVGAVPPLEGAAYGAAATAVAQIATTPLDVIRNRAMIESQGAGEVASGSFVSRYICKFGEIAREEGLEALWAGIYPRIGKSVVSGAVQFGSYEISKGRLASAFKP